MRLIDADALWENVESAGWWDNADRDIAEDLIINAPTIDKWIDVKKELPLPYTPVLVAIYDEALEFYYRGIAWTDALDNWSGDSLAEDEKVIYWTPLLPAPENKYDK